MKIANNTIVQLAYTVSEIDHQPLERSTPDAPLTVLIGHGKLIPGLERALMDKTAGDRIEVDITARDAYGPYREGLSQRLPKKKFGKAKIAAGMQVVLETQFGPRAVTVNKVGMTVVDVDLNHPFAGKDLHFTVDILAVREATAEDIANGPVTQSPA